MINAPTSEPPKADWEVKTLGEVCRFIDYRGKTPKKTETGLRLITAKNVRMGFLKKEPEEFVSPGSYENWMTRGIPKVGDVLFTTEAPLGLVCQLDTDEKVVFAQRIITLQPNRLLTDSTFLKFTLMSPLLQSRILEQATGATAQGIKSSLLKKIPIPVPPLAEQERIVGILDEAFEGIAAATAQAQKNLHNARELFQSVLQSTFSQKGDDWVETTLGENANFRNGMNFSKNSRGQTVKVVGVGDFKQRFWVPTESLEDKTIDGELDKQDQLLEDDFLFVRSNGNKELIGRCMLMGSISAPITYSGFTIRMRLEEADFLPLFLCWYLKSDHARSSLIGSGSGAQISNLNQGTLSALRAPLPPLPTQQAIVEKLDALSQETKRLEAIYERKKVALSELKQSLLQKAFAGEL